MMPKDEAIETLIGQTRAAIKLHQDAPTGVELRRIEADLVRLRDPDVARKLKRRPIERSANRAAA